MVSWRTRSLAQLSSSAERVARLAHLTSVEEETGTLDIIFQRLSEGESLGDIALSWDVPRGRLLSWLMGEGSRWDVYRKGLEVLAHALVSEAVGIADDGVDIARDKLRIDTRFRIARHHAPGVYAERDVVGGSRVVVVVNAGVCEAAIDGSAVIEGVI